MAKIVVSKWAVAKIVGGLHAVQAVATQNKRSFGNLPNHVMQFLSNSVLLSLMFAAHIRGRLMALQ